MRSPDLDGDLAPPTGFTEICSQDHGLCAELTAGYPPGTNTLGYFLVSEEWAARQKSQPVSLSRYLIAQATSTSAASFPALKRFLRERNGVLPDHTVPPDEMANLERFDLGVVDETADSITFGMILQLHASPAHGSLEPQIALNIAFLLHGHVMSLYVHHAFKDRRDVAAAKKLAADWLACLRTAAK